MFGNGVLCSLIPEQTYYHSSAFASVFDLGGCNPETFPDAALGSSPNTFYLPYCCSRAAPLGGSTSQAIGALGTQGRAEGAERCTNEN